jgi:cation transport ATPase
MGMDGLSDKHSADGEFWWDGSVWRPAYTQDRKYWFNGTSWIESPKVSRMRLTKVEKRVAVSLLGWLLVWIAWAVWATNGGHFVPDGQINFQLTPVASNVGAILVVAWLAFAFIVFAWLSWQNRWPQWATMLGCTIVVSIVSGLTLSFLMFVSPSHLHGLADAGTTAIGAASLGALGLAFEGPWFLATIGLGTLVGFAARKLTHRQRPEEQLAH